MACRFPRAICAHVLLLAVAVSCDLPTALAVPGQGAVNSSRPSSGKYKVWRGKTHEAPTEGHIEASIVYVYEVGVGANAQLMAQIYLYSAKEQTPGAKDYKLELTETYQGVLRSRLPSPGKGHGRNRELNLVFDAEVPDSAGLRRRLLLTASRTPVGGPSAADRTVRLVTSTYRPVAEDSEPDPEPDSQPGCGDDPPVAPAGKVGPITIMETKTSVLSTGCSDYPDDAVLYEETIDGFDVNNNPMPDPTWEEYPETEWEDWEVWP